jgi:hypothetical protein
VSGTEGHFNSATQVLGEALCEPEYSKHVEEPRSVYKVGGTMSVRQLQEKRTSILDGLRETVTRKDSTTYTRKLRNDAATLYTEIHSHPLPALEKRPNKPKQPRPSKNRETQKKNKIKREAQLAPWEVTCQEVAARKTRGPIPEKKPTLSR